MNWVGLQGGAIYHHFKSKEEIMDALTDKMFRENNPFDTVKNQKRFERAAENENGNVIEPVR